MRKTIIITVTIFAFALLAASCGGDKYAEVKTLLGQYIALTNDFGKALDTADSGKKVAEAINTYIKKAKTLGPRVEALPEKYPELQGNPPEELKALLVEFEESAGSLEGYFEKLTQYMDDPDVLKALEGFENIQ